MKTIASFGCGVDSVAGILIEGLGKYDEIIFADTGSEKPETYVYLDYIMHTKGWKITIVKSKYGNIYDYYYDKIIRNQKFISGTSFLFQ